MSDHANEYVTVCAGCGALASTISVTDQWIDGKAVSGHWVCAECGHRFGIWMDGGTLDLETVREQVTGSVSTFEVFTDPPPG